MSFTGISWYVAPDGSPRGDGSAKRPWDIVTALGHPSQVEPGDVIWLRGGVYSVKAPIECRLTGVEGQPIQVWGDPDDDRRPLLEFADARPQALHITGAYAWYGDFEIRCTSVARWSDVPGSVGNPRGTGILCESGLGVKLFRLILRDFGSSMFESQASGIEISACVLANAYWDAPDRSHGPGFYVRNPRGAPRKRIAGNVVFQHGRQGLQGFGSTPFAEVDVIGNVFLNNGVAKDGLHRNFMFGNASDEHWNVVIERNTAYFPKGARLGHEANMAGGDGGSHQLVLRDNWLAHEGRPALRVHRAADVTITGNRIVGGVEYTSLDGSVQATGSEFAQLFPENTYFDETERPSGVWSRVHRDESLPDEWRGRGRATVTVLNWDLSPDVDVDVSTLAAEGGLDVGASLKVWPAQNPDVGLTYVYGGEALRLPMHGWAPAWPAGRDAGNALPGSFPEFGVFVLEWSTGGASTPKEHGRLADPGAGMTPPNAKAARQQSWSIADASQRNELRKQRRAQWRAQTLERML